MLPPPPDFVCVQQSYYLLTHQPCIPRSASYSSTTGECRISDMDRHTVAGTTAFQESIGDEYLENNCVDDPVKLCDFQLLENRIMKTVDSVYQVSKNNTQYNNTVTPLYKEYPSPPKTFA